MNEIKFLKLLKAHIFSNHGTQSAAAIHWGVSNNFVSLVVNGIKAPNDVILSDLGYTVKKQTIRTYTKVV